MITAYLGGPDVFLKTAATTAKRKIAICAAHGIVAKVPSDTDPVPPGTGWAQVRAAIYGANMRMMTEADIGIFNLSPFRGPSADVGTAVELGVMTHMGKPVFGYSRDPRQMADRVRDRCGCTRTEGVWRDPDGHLIEDMEGFDNLMLTEAIAAGGLRPFTGGHQDGLAAMTAFEECVRAVAAFMKVGRTGA